MSRLQSRIADFKRNYEVSKSNIEKKVEFGCPQCHKKYSTENGLHNHRKKNNCVRKRREGREGRGKRKSNKAKVEQMREINDERIL